VAAQAKVSRMEAATEGNAATRLLAQKGFNMEKMTRDLKSYELHTTFEDVFPLEGATVEEYLQQVCGSWYFQFFSLARIPPTPH
jgi:nuclear pore complex protein Nup93